MHFCPPPTHRPLSLSCFDVHHYLDKGPEGDRDLEMTVQKLGNLHSSYWKHTRKKVKVKLLSRVPLFGTSWTVAYQSPPSMGFSRQEYWSGLPFPSPMHKSEVAQSCLTLLDLMDCSLPVSSVHGIFQARVLEWGAIAFSD